MDGRAQERAAIDTSDDKHILPGKTSVTDDPCPVTPSAPLQSACRQPPRAVGAPPLLGGGLHVRCSCWWAAGQSLSAAVKQTWAGMTAPTQSPARVTSLHRSAGAAPCCSSGRLGSRAPASQVSVRAGIASGVPIPPAPQPSDPTVAPSGAPGDSAWLPCPRRWCPRCAGVGWGV